MRYTALIRIAANQRLRILEDTLKNHDEVTSEQLLEQMKAMEIAIIDLAQNMEKLEQAVDTRTI